MLQGAAFRLLAGFYNSDNYNFTGLCRQAGYPTDLGGYYLRQLVQRGYVEKVGRGHYRILAAGKQHLAFYYGKRLLAPRPRLHAMLIVRQADNLIVIRRKVQPFIGMAEWPAVAVNLGEPLTTAAHRVLEARLGVTAETQLVGFFRRIDFYKEQPFDDKTFAVHTCSLEPGTTYSPNSPIGDNLACTSAALRQLSKQSKALPDILAFVEGNPSGPVEYTYRLSAADLGVTES